MGFNLTHSELIRMPSAGQHLEKICIGQSVPARAAIGLSKLKDAVDDILGIRRNCDVLGPLLVGYVLDNPCDSSEFCSGDRLVTGHMLDFDDDVGSGGIVWLKLYDRPGGSACLMVQWGVCRAVRVKMQGVMIVANGCMTSVATTVTKKLAKVFNVRERVRQRQPYFSGIAFKIGDGLRVAIAGGLKGGAMKLLMMMGVRLITKSA